MLMIALRALGKVPWQVWAAVALIAAFLVHGKMQYREGYAAAAFKYQAAANQEALRQFNVNAEALEAAKREAAQHRETIATLDKQLEDLALEAKRDPRAGQPSLGAGSLRRLDAIH